MVSRAPVSLCIIVKNEPFLEKSIQSIRDYVEEIVIVDTGSTDGTAEIAKKYADIFDSYTACNDPQTGLIEDFSQARQHSFDLATQKWVMWCDADDIIEGGENLNSIIEGYTNTDPNHAVAYLFPYEYAYNELGQCICQHYRERLFSNKNFFKWVNPVHEVVVPVNNVQTSLVTREELTFKHHRQFIKKSVEPSRNLRILKKYFEKVGESDARQLYYLGLEYCNSGFIDESIKCLTRYIELSGWEDEQVMACLKLVDIYQAQNNLEEALKWAFKCITFKETWGEGYFTVAKVYYFMANRGGPQELRNWERCAYFAKTGLSLPPTKTLLFINPQDREVEIHKYLNLALNKLGDIKGALDSVNIGIKGKPDDPHFIGNKKLYEDFLARQKITENLFVLKNNNTITTNSFDQTIAIINGQQIPELTVSKNSSIGSSLDIVFYAGDGLEIWTPETVKVTGIGGSELMLIELSKRLVTLGHKVRVYNSCGEGDGKVFDGVTYYQSNKFHHLECDVLIVSRQAQALSDSFQINARLKLLWVHDIWALGATNELLLKADRILALSHWHKDLLVNFYSIHPNHVIVTRNGINLKRFEKNVARNPHKCINSSSPDRSWPVLLSVWPTIRARVPDAELHLFYGFKNWIVSAQSDTKQMDLITSLQNRIQELSSLGVVFHDRINQEQLAEEFLSAGAWIHPTWFSETSCITAMEAQAAGLRMVTSNIAALKETAGARATLLEGEWTSPEYQAKFMDSVVDVLNNTSEDDRKSLQIYAKENFDLDKLAKDWHQMFYQLISDIKSDPLVPYYPSPKYRNLKSENTISMSKEVKLNIAAGPNIFPFDGWINYDRETFKEYFDYISNPRTGTVGMPDYQKPSALYLQNGGKLDFRIQDMCMPFTQHDSNTVDIIYVGQAIEHINPLHQAPQFLTECFRMLKPGGILRMTTPDLDLLIQAYLKDKMNDFASEQPDFYTKVSPGMQLALIMFGSSGPNCKQTLYEGHMCLYTQQSMRDLLAGVGFKEIEFYYETGKSKNPIIAQEVADAGMSHSFIVEAVK